MPLEKNSQNKYYFHLLPFFITFKKIYKIYIIFTSCFFYLKKIKKTRPKNSCTRMFVPHIVLGGGEGLEGGGGGEGGAAASAGHRGTVVPGEQGGVLPRESVI